MITGSHFTDEKSEALAADMTSKCQDVKPCLSSPQTFLSHPLPQVSHCDLLRAPGHGNAKEAQVLNRRLPSGVIHDKPDPSSKYPLRQVCP